MFKNKLKRFAAVTLAGMMVISMTACSTSKGAEKKQVAEKTEQRTEATTETKGNTTTDYVASDVVLPDKFDNMIYPIEALMVQKFSRGYDYYTDSSSEDESDSFWFSMAVLTSLMQTQTAYGEATESDSFYYLKEDISNMYASALYDAYGKGDLEFPEISDGDKYVTYDDDKGMYGFLKGDVESLVPYITDCTKDGKDYMITAELRSTETDEVKGTYEIGLTSTSYDGDENYFSYSVTSVKEKKDSDQDSTTATSEEAESTDKATDTETTTENENTTEENTSDNQQSTGSDSSSSEAISQDDALSQAQDYYGSDAEYSYKQKVTVGDKEYYDFSVKGDDISSTDVLVSTDGQDVIGGTQNDDGSWSFDQ